jgi:hypothetical protein
MGPDETTAKACIGDHVGLNQVMVDTGNITLPSNPSVADIRVLCPDVRSLETGITETHDLATPVGKHNALCSPL